MKVRRLDTETRTRRKSGPTGGVGVEESVDSFRVKFGVKFTVQEKL